MPTSKGKYHDNKTMVEDPVREKNDVTKQDKGKDNKNKAMEEDPVREEEDVTEQDKKLQGLVAAAMKEMLNGDDDLVITISKRKNIADQIEAERAENKAKQNSPEGPTGGIPKENWLVGLTRGVGSMALMFGASVLGTLTGESLLTRIQAKEANKNMEHELMKQEQKAQEEARATAGCPSSITIKPEISVNPRFAVFNLSKD